jgi:hypothetical protein
MAAVLLLEADMRKRVAFRCVTAAALLMAAAAPVWAALEGKIDYSQAAAPEVDMDMITGSINPDGGSAPACGPVYVPRLVHERDGSIVGMAYELDGDDC